MWNIFLLFLKIHRDTRKRISRGVKGKVKCFECYLVYILKIIFHLINVCLSFFKDLAHEKENFSWMLYVSSLRLGTFQKEQKIYDVMFLKGD